MKKVLFIQILFMFSGCNLIKLDKLLNEQEISLKDNKVSFKIVNNRILLENDVNFMLDTGAPNIIFKNKKSNFKIKDSISIGTTESPVGEEIENKGIVIDSISNQFFSIKNAVFRDVDKSFCNSSYGLIGPELFEGQSIEIDFEKNKIYKIQTTPNYIKDFEKIKVAKFDGSFFKIPIIVNDVLIDVKLDTGNPYDLVLTDADFNKIEKNKFYSYYKNNEYSSNSYGVTTMNTFSDKILVKSTSKIKRNLLGVGFMKNYNWILDYKNGYVYVKKISNNNPKYLFNRVVISNGKLIYNETYSKDNIKFLGHSVISIKGTAITSTNICEMQDLLNNTEDWKSLNIETESIK